MSRRWSGNIICIDEFEDLISSSYFADTTALEVAFPATNNSSKLGLVGTNRTDAELYYSDGISWEPRVVSGVENPEFASLIEARADTDYDEGTLGIIPTGNVRLVSGVWVPEFVYRMGSPVTVGTLSGKVLPSVEGWTHTEDGPENITTDGTHVRLWTDVQTERAQIFMSHTKTGFRYMWCDLLHRQASQGSAGAAACAHVSLYDGVNAYTMSTARNDGRWAGYAGPSTGSTSTSGALVSETVKPSLGTERRLTIVCDTTLNTKRTYLDGNLVAADAVAGSVTAFKMLAVGDSATTGTLDWYLRSLAWGVA